MINCILGKSKTGKTTHIYQNIDSDLKEGRNVLLFVPSQSRAKAEEEYMKILGKNGVIGVNITTISEFVNEEVKLQNLHIEDNFMSRLDRKIVLTQVIKENPDLFNIFKKVKNYPGFLDILDIYMDLLRKSEINPEEYTALELKNKRTDNKFKEILSIYNKYLEKITEKYIDTLDEMQMFLENIDKSSYFKDVSNLKVYFDSYNNFSNNEYKLIDMLMKKGIDITFTLNTDITKIEDIYTSSSIFETPNKTYERICALANKNDVALENIVKYENIFKCSEDIKYVANNMLENDSVSKERIDAKNIEVTMYTNILKEVEAIAKNITQKVKEGYKYNDFAIYTSTPEDYERIIAKVFYENNLNYYISKSKNISESILTKYIQGILNLANKGLNLELVFDILKQGLTDVDLRKIYMLENYMREFNVNKYLVNNDFTLNNYHSTYNLEELNETRKSIVSMYNFVYDLKKGTVKDIISALYNHLSDNNIYSNYVKMTTPITEDNVNLDMNNFESQVWNSLLDIFESIEKVYKDEEITIEEFTNIFNLVVKDIKIKTLPPTKDQIEIVDINVSKINARKIVFFVGVTEGKFPKKENEDIIFSDSELEMLKEKEIELRETSISKINMGLFNIYEALNNIAETLYITIPAATMDGKATRKSSLITLLGQVLNFEIKGEVTNTDSNVDIRKTASKEDLFMWLIKNIRDFNTKESNVDIVDIYTVYEYFKEDEHYSKILAFKKDDSNLSKEIVDIIYSDEFKTSVSKLEAYIKCPFSYFMEYILKVEPNGEAEVNRLELGSFMHGVIEVFSKKVIESEIRWQDVLDESCENLKPEYEKLIEEIVFGQIDDTLSKQKQSVKYMVLKRKLINTMKKIIKSIALGYIQSEFEPYGYEIEFKDNSKEALLPMVIQLDDGRQMKLIGKIDRVDMLKFRDSLYIRVLDYKSSSRELTLDKIKDGISLQLITYMIALMENNKEKERMIPAGIVYFHLPNSIVSIDEYAQTNEVIKQKLIEKLKMNGLFLRDVEVLNKMDKNFEVTKESYLKVTKAAVDKKSKAVLEENEFEELCENTKKTLKDIGNELAKGNVKICPNKKADACKYCNYSSTCRRNIEV